MHNLSCLFVGIECSPIWLWAQKSCFVNCQTAVSMCSSWSWTEDINAQHFQLGIRCSNWEARVVTGQMLTFGVELFYLQKYTVVIRRNSNLGVSCSYVVIKGFSVDFILVILSPVPCPLPTLDAGGPEQMSMKCALCALKKERCVKGLHGKCTFPKKGYRGSVSFFQSFCFCGLLK